jgi:hypothetical protein
MIDPELKYCPRCSDEYRAEIEKCAACEIALITGAQKLTLESQWREKVTRRKGELTPEDEIVVIERGPLNDLRRLEDILAAERIGSRLVGDQHSCSKNCCPSNFYLQVRTEDAADALRLIALEHERSTGLGGGGCRGHEREIYNPHAGEAICPACGFRFSTSSASCPDCGLCFS